MKQIKMLRLIKQKVEQDLGLSNIAIRSRQRDYVFARFLYYKIAHENCRTSLSNIAKAVDRDHSTVVYGIRQFDELLTFNAKEYKYLQDAYDNISISLQEPIDYNLLDLSNVLVVLDSVDKELKRVKRAVLNMVNEGKQNKILED